MGEGMGNVTISSGFAIPTNWLNCSMSFRQARLVRGLSMWANYSNSAGISADP
jgi:hypothetical protein